MTLRGRTSKDRKDDKPEGVSGYEWQREVGGWGLVARKGKQRVAHLSYGEQVKRQKAGLAAWLESKGIK